MAEILAEMGGLRQRTLTTSSILRLTPSRRAIESNPHHVPSGGGHALAMKCYLSYSTTSRLETVPSEVAPRKRDKGNNVVVKRTAGVHGAGARRRCSNPRLVGRGVIVPGRTSGP